MLLADATGIIDAAQTLGPCRITECLLVKPDNQVIVVSGDFKPRYPRKIARFMCQASEETLWRPIQPWITARAPGLMFNARIGTGRATYCRFENKRQAVGLTFGQELVADHQNPERVLAWLSTTEVLQRGYFNRELSFINLVSHVVCHEVAHVVQVVRGERTRNSVHNAGFYRILDRMHERGHADRVKNHLTTLLSNAGIPLEYWSATDLPPAGSSRRAEFRCGRKVVFAYKGQTVEARIVSVNPKTLSVIGSSQDGSVFKGRVPPSLCELAEGGVS